MNRPSNAVVARVRDALLLSENACPPCTNAVDAGPDIPPAGMDELHQALSMQATAGVGAASGANAAAAAPASAAPAPPQVDTRTHQELIYDAKQVCGNASRNRIASVLDDGSVCIVQQEKSTTRWYFPTPKKRACQLLAFGTAFQIGNKVRIWGEDEFGVKEVTDVTLTHNGELWVPKGECILPCTSGATPLSDITTAEDICVS